MNDALTITIGNARCQPCICLSGEMDISNADRLSPALLSACERDVSVMHLDITGLTFMDSSGLHRIIQLHRAARERGIHLLVRIKDGTIIQRVIRTVGADSVLYVERGDALGCVTEDARVSAC